MHAKRSFSAAAGFSLIEVMISIFVLGFGLLALVAMQSGVVRAGADAKARSRVALLLSSKLDEARATGYHGLAVTTLPLPVLECVSGNDICEAQADAAVNDLGVSLQVVRHVGAAGTESEYKRLTVTGSWTDAGGATRMLTMQTDVSPRSLDSTSTIVDQALAGDVGKMPVVRVPTSLLETAGVVPIALGDGSASAASNPTPELIGRNKNTEVVGTRFDTLTYAPTGDDSVMRRRVETAVVKCSCSFDGQSPGDASIYAAAQWPAVWTGMRYDVYVPKSGGKPPGESARAWPTAGVDQSPLCLECCRDHHDGAASGVAKFDPERPDDSLGKFSPVGNVGTPEGAVLGASPVTSGSYVNACRLVRVDGLWRTAADMYLRQLGLLPTGTAVGSDQAATTGLPKPEAISAYETFVKNYIRQYTGISATAPANADEKFNELGELNAPQITISRPSSTDYRYLHARALYIDYLEPVALEKIRNAYNECPAGKAREDCILPYLPFTSANLTEIARWDAKVSGSDEADTGVLIVNSGNLLGAKPQEPSGGRTIGVGPGEADNVVLAGRSNAGIAVTERLRHVLGVDPADWSAQAQDRQAFKVNGAPTGDRFFVKLVGGGTNPFVQYIIGTDQAECLKPKNSDHVCATGSTLPSEAKVRVSRFWSVGSQDQRITCSTGAGSVTQSYAVPRLINYRVASTNPASASVVREGTDGGQDEAAVVTFTTVNAGGILTITLQEETSTVFATMKSCTLNGGNNKIQSVLWNEDWAN